MVTSAVITILFIEFLLHYQSPANDASNSLANLSATNHISGFILKAITTSCDRLEALAYSIPGST